jgi:hypothetical protein
MQQALEKAVPPLDMNSNTNRASRATTVHMMALIR